MPDPLCDMNEIVRVTAARDAAEARRRLYQETLKQPPPRQRKMLDGMDCLKGQTDLFDENN
jgi:hypothetical protein